MPVAVKISSETSNIASAPAQTVTGQIAVPPGSNIALDLPPSAVQGYAREGTDLLVHLKTGEVLRVTNFYIDPSKLSNLMLVENGELVAADVAQVSTVTSAAAYTPIDAAAGFQTAEAATAGGVAGGTAGGIGGLAGGALLPLGVLAGGGLIAAAAGGGGNDGEDAPPPDTTPPAAATNLAIDAEGDQLTGRAEAGATVLVDVDADGSVEYTVQAGADGNFLVALSPALLDGETVRVTVRDAAGNTGPVATVSAPDGTPPPPAFRLLFAQLGGSITGSGEPGATVTIDVDGDGTDEYTATIAADGTFSVTLEPALDNGQTVHVTVTDTAGNTSETVVVAAPDLTPPPSAAPQINPSDGTSIAGTVGEGTGVVLTDGAGTVIGQVAVDANGNWSFTPTTPLPDGTVVSVAAVNAQGEPGPSASVTIDAVAPAAPVIDPSNGTVVGGTAEAGATILLTDGNGNPIGQAVADASGNWSFTPDPALTDGSVVRASAKDAAGNVGASASLVVDGVAPAAPTLYPPSGTVVSGTAEAGGTVLVTGANGAAIGQAAVDANGNWTLAVTPPLADGTVITAVTRDAAGNTGTSATATVDAVAPATPTITPSNGAALSGTAEAGSTVTLTDAGGTVIGRVSADGNGDWTFTPATPLPDGTVVNVTARDAAGNASPVATTTIDATAPAAPVIQASNGTTLSGTAEPGATITLTDDEGTAIGQTMADEAGNWSFTPASTLPDGTVVSATATDAAGNVGPAGTTTIDGQAPAAPVLAPSNGAAISGTAEAGATVLLSDADGNAIGEAVADENGDWSFLPGTPLADGAEIVAVARDAAGNVGASASTTVDAVAPAEPIIDPSNGVTLSGSAEAGALVILTDGNGNAISQVQADGGGNWSFTPATPLPDGSIVNAVARDDAGNESNGVDITVDAVAPEAPAIDPSNGTEVTGTAEAGATILLTDGNGNPIGEVLADADGRWTLAPDTPLPDGTVINAVARDEAGNVSEVGSTTVDAVAPGDPTIDPSDGTQVTGTAEAGATILLTDGEGNAIGETSADEDGNWTFTPGAPLPDQTVIDAVARDAAGNTSGEVSTTVDSDPPADPTIDPTNGSVVTGTAEPNSTVVLIDGTNGGQMRAVSDPVAQVPNLGLVIGQTQADADGNWTFTPAIPLPDGTVVIAVSVDAAGNVSTDVSTIVDGVPPDAPTIDPTIGLFLAGTAEAGVELLLSDGNGDPIGEALADEDGNWSFTPGIALPDGTEVVVIARDEAGNLSGPASTIVDAVAPLVPTVDPSNGLTITGTAEPGGVVILVDAIGNPIGETTADVFGNWSFTPATPLPNVTVVHVSVRDGAGNVGPEAITTIDTVPPAGPTLSLQAAGTLLTGSAEPNSTVRIVIDGDEDNGVLVPVDGNGAFSLPLLEPLIANETITAVAIDAAGNESVAITVIAPDIAAPQIEVPEALDGWINAQEATGGIQVEIAVRPTMRAGQVLTAQFSGQGGYQALATHTLTGGDIAAGFVILTIVPSGTQGPLPQGAATIVADVGGGDASPAVTFTVDTAPPSTPVLSLVGSVLNISGAPGSELTVTADLGGTDATATVIADADGLASVNLLSGLNVGLDWASLLDAQVSVTDTDQAGNTSNVATLDPLSSIGQPVTVGNFAVDASLNPLSPRLGITGTTTPGAVVVLSVVTPALNVELLPVQADSSGNFSLNLLSPAILNQLQLSATDLLNLGSQISVGVVATDAQGNESASYLVDLTPNGLTLGIGQVDVNGTVGDDVMTGTPTINEHINGGSGNDLILDVGPGDHVSAGPGNDTIQITAPNFASVDGGTGFDTVLLSNGIDLDYGPGVGTFTSIERFDLGTADGSSVLTLTAAEVLAITDAGTGHALQVTGDTDDILRITGATLTGTTQIDGLVYDVYTYGASIVRVEENTVQVVV